jgi:hypothetical protein
LSELVGESVREDEDVEEGDEAEEGEEEGEEERNSSCILKFSFPYKGSDSLS